MIYYTLQINKIFRFSHYWIGKLIKSMKWLEFIFVKCCLLKVLFLHTTQSRWNKHLLTNITCLTIWKCLSFYTHADKYKWICAYQICMSICELKLSFVICSLVYAHLYEMIKIIIVFIFTSAIYKVTFLLAIIHTWTR